MKVFSESTTFVDAAADTFCGELAHGNGNMESSGAITSKKQFDLCFIFDRNCQPSIYAKW